MFAALVLAAVLQRPDVQSCVERVLKDGGYGHLRFEGAAFLLRDGDAFACEMWPRTMGFHSTSWSGRIPPNAVAIIHSHPADNPNPSFADVQLARRLGIAVLVATPHGITAAGADESTANLLRKLTY
jgi:hypothetical protein